MRLRHHHGLPLLLASIVGSVPSCSRDGLAPSGASVPDLTSVAAPLDEGVPVSPDLSFGLCADNLMDGDETDTDCGGATCGACVDGGHCGRSEDCTSRRCQMGVCRPANPCIDGVRDEAETDVDCGGPVCPYCAAGKACGGDGDCAANLICAFGFCRAPLSLRLFWKAPVAYDTGDWPFDIAAGDLNRDGKVDLLILNQNDSTVSALLGLGDGTFVAAKVSPTGKLPLNMLLADFDTDGKLDFAVRLAGTTDLYVASGRGDGTFDAGVRSPVVQAYGGWAAGDLDGDGLPDIAAGGDFEVRVMLNRGKGHFAEGAVIATPSPGCGPSSATVADLDRDGRLDIVNICGGALAFSEAAGKGLFARSKALQGTGSFAAVYDFDRDEHPDIVTSGADLFRGGAKFNFAAPKWFDVGFERTVTVADLNRDGHADLIFTPSQPAGTLAIAGGLAGPSFAATYYWPTPAASIARVAIADFNRDGKPDIAFTDSSSKKLYVMLNDSR